MDIILNYQLDKKKYHAFAKRPQSFMQTLDLADRLGISRSSALSANADMLDAVRGCQNASKFMRYASNHIRNSKSQLLQDIFASYCISDQNPSFLEFGATDGVSLSNSYFLEKVLGWSGVLAEPSPQWHTALKHNRPSSRILFDCIWSETGKQLDFFVSDAGVLSTISGYKDSDKESMPGNTSIRNAKGYLTKVNTLSLTDVLYEFFPSSGPSYMSIDTEGSEFDILRSCDFKSHRPKVLTVEHNFTKLNASLDDLLCSHNYNRVFSQFTDFDAWYVSNEIYENVFVN